MQCFCFSLQLQRTGILLVCHNFCLLCWFFLQTHFVRKVIMVPELSTQSSFFSKFKFGIFVVWKNKDKNPTRCASFQSKIRTILGYIKRQTWKKFKFFKLFNTKIHPFLFLPSLRNFEFKICTIADHISMHMWDFFPDFFET